MDTAERLVEHNTLVCHLVRWRCTSSLHVSTPTELLDFALLSCQLVNVVSNALSTLTVLDGPIGHIVNRRWSHLAFPLCRETGLKPAKVCHTMRHPTILSSCRRLKANSPRTKVSCSCNPRLLLLHDPSPQMRKLLSPSYPAL